MEKLELIAPCHFGLEAVLKREITDLGYEVAEVTDGKVSFYGDWAAVCYANVFLRTAERILVKAGSFHAESFEDLFQGTRAIPWEELIPKDGRFWVAKATSVKSRLFSPRDIQSIMKKAMVERMAAHYHLTQFPESGADYPVRVTILKDEVTVGIDTTGTSLHKRGYRLMTAKAPISETLAAALIMLTPWKKDRILVDPFCGSGTFPIEAAMMAAGIAPGMNREFLAEQWENLIPKKAWYDAVDDASSRIDDRIETDIRHPKKYGFVITNPPYGERLEDRKALPALYREIGQAFRGLDSWSEYIITSYEDAERYIGKKADKNRKIYNGMIKTYFYQYIGPKPPARRPAPEGTGRDKR